MEDVQRSSRALEQRRGWNEFVSIGESDTSIDSLVLLYHPIEREPFLDPVPRLLAIVR